MYLSVVLWVIMGSMYRENNKTKYYLAIVDIDLSPALPQWLIG